MDHIFSGKESGAFYSELRGYESLKDHAHRKAARLLLAEDNPVNQLVAIKMLEKLGYQVDAASNGLEVLAALSTKPYDIVLMDCQMPGMDGFEASRQVRIIEGEDRHTIIIAMTANALPGDHEACIKAGMDDYLSKPVDYKVMATLLDSWLLKLDPPGCLSDPSGPSEDSEVVCDEIFISDDFDKAGFMDRIIGDKVLARELIGMFILETPNQIEALGQAIKSGDAEQVKRHAHKIRGAAVNMCARNLGKKAAEIERAGNAGKLTTLDTSLADLQLYFEVMKNLMEAGL